MCCADAVDPRVQWAAFEDHERACRSCREAPTGRALCPEGGALFDAALGDIGLEPNAMTLDLSGLSVSDLDVELRIWEVDGAWPWADQADGLARWRAAKRFRGFNGLVRAGLLTDWPAQL